MKGKFYTLTPTTYTNRKGKTSEMHFVKFNRELSEELDFYQHHGFEIWEYDTYEEVRNEQARKALENFDKQEYYGNIADKMAERQRKEEQLKEKEHGEEGDIETESERGDGADIEAESGREEPSDATGGEVLPGSGAVSARGTGEGSGEQGGSAGVGYKGGKPDGDATAGGEAEGGRVTDNPGGGVRFRFARDREDFDALHERAIEKKGVVMPGLAEKEFEVVEVPRHPFRGSGEEARKAAQEWGE